MDNKKQQAQRLYMQGGMTQKEIAASVGVSERTVYTWVHQYAWDKLRLASYQAPATIADNLCSQIVELQNAIARREPGKRYPTPEEAEVQRKLIISLERMKKSPSLSQNIQVLETFRNYMRPVDKKFTRDLGNYIERFLSGKSINGFAPYQAEYCVDAVSPMSQFYDEVEENGTKPEVTPCPNVNSCLHVGNCTYPHCQHPERYTPQPTPTEIYAVPPIHFEHPVIVSPVELQAESGLPAVGTGSIPAAGPTPLLPAAALAKEGHSAEPVMEPVPIISGSLPKNEPAAGTGSDPATFQYRNEQNNPDSYRDSLPETNKNITPAHQPRKRLV